MAFKTVLAGSVAGISGTLVCHPMDTVRTRLQTAPVGTFTGAADCVVKCVRNEGPFALYKGLLMPLLAQGVYKSVIFSTYNMAQDALRGTGSTQPDQRHLFACGFLAGGVNSFVVTPVELLRNRLMVQYSRERHVGPLSMMRGIVKEHGLSGMWKGQLLTLLRDSIGVGCWYSAYEVVIAHLKQRSRANGGDGNVGALSLLVAGAMAGISYWAAVLPVDTVKSLVQTDMEGRYTGMADCVRQVVRQEGVLRLYRGWSVAMSRGIPSSSVTFLVYGKLTPIIDELL
jgi:hypothetical protein